MLANTPVEFNYLETPAKIFIKPARRNQFIQENILNKFFGLLSPIPVFAGFYMIYAEFHLFKFPQEEITVVHVLSFITNYM